jgi:twitching motility protein PilT
MDYKGLLHTMVSKGASDLHLRVGCVPYFRISGDLYGAKSDPISPEELRVVMQDILSPEQIEQLAHHDEIDAAIGIAGIGRFRVNVYSQRNTPAFAFRHIKTDIPQFQALNIPNVALEIAMQRRGLILVTGTTGSGKSTLLASMIDHINENRAVNIITVEDPIEFLHKNKKAAIAQREVGQDTVSYSAALRAAMRQDPDIILMGEIRDEETMIGALTAADTGHLVLSTMHTLNAIETVSRAVSFFPHYQHEQIRLLLGSVLAAVISMRLIPKIGGGMIPACEIMVNNSTVEEYLLDGHKLKMIPDIIAAGHKQYGSQTFDQSLESLYRAELVEFSVAQQYASNPDDFELKVLGGISGASDRDQAIDGDDVLEMY